MCSFNLCINKKKKNINNKPSQKKKRAKAKKKQKKIKKYKGNHIGQNMAGHRGGCVCEVYFYA